MAATSNDIAGWFVVLKSAAGELAGADLPPAEREKVQLLADVAVRIGESVVTDLNRIAYALEHHAHKG